MNYEELLEKRKKWYDFVPVQFEIVKCLYHKELAFIDKDMQKKTMRYFIAFTKDYLLKNFEVLNFLKYNINVYHSVSYLKDIPLFSWNFKIRTKEQKYIDFNKDYSNHIIGYDFFCDFDGKENFNLCHEEAKEFKKLLETHQVPYYILNSSFSGFHIIIPNQFFNQDNILENIKTFGKVISNIKITYNLETLDDSVCDMKRLKKLPFSFVSDGSVAFPLTDERFSNFSKEIVEVDYLLKNVTIKGHGLLTRTYNLSEEQLKLNTLKFIENYI